MITNTATGTKSTTNWAVDLRRWDKPKSFLASSFGLEASPRFQGAREGGPSCYPKIVANSAATSTKEPCLGRMSRTSRRQGSAGGVCISQRTAHLCTVAPIARRPRPQTVERGAS